MPARTLDHEQILTVADQHFRDCDREHLLICMVVLPDFLVWRVDPELKVDVLNLHTFRTTQCLNDAFEVQ